MMVGLAGVLEKTEAKVSDAEIQFEGPIHEDIESKLEDRSVLPEYCDIPGFQHASVGRHHHVEEIGGH